jgi:hypothetical protein
MKSEKVLWIVIVILAVGLGLSWNTLLDVKEDNHAALKDAMRSTDYMDIQNTFAKHCYYYAAQEQWLELETVWSKERDDISYGHNNGYYLGRESVENYYGQKNEDRRKQTLEMMSRITPGVENAEENEGIGDLVMHTLTTPIIEVATDRETAQGVWMSVGLASRVGQDGKPQYVEFWERFAVDFVREDGQWKIWHFQIHSDVMFSIPESMWGMPGIVSQPKAADGASSAGPAGGGPPQGMEGAPGEGQPPQEGPGGPGGGQAQAMKNDMDRQVQMHEMYSATTVPELSPKLPAPYDTWEDTTAYIK